GPTDGDVPDLAAPVARGPEPRGRGHVAADGAGATLRLGCVGRDRVPGEARGATAVRLGRVSRSSAGEGCGGEGDPAGGRPEAEGQRDLVAGRECRGDAGIACRGVDGTLGGDDGKGAGSDGRGPAARLAVGGARHRDGVELGSTDQATGATTSILRAGKDDRCVTLFGNPPGPMAGRRI